MQEVLQSIARARTRGEQSPLVLLRSFPDEMGLRIPHLPVDGEFGTAWVAMSGEPFRPHQAPALAALKRGEPVALMASHPHLINSAYLLMFATLHGAPGSAALLLAPHDDTVGVIHEALNNSNANLPTTMRIPVAALGRENRVDPHARVVIATPDTLHHRLLRYHDRAWTLFWRRLHMLVLPDLHFYTGIASAHLTDLWQRIQRLSAAYRQGRVPGVLGTINEVKAPEEALATILGTKWRVVPSDDIGYEGTTLAIWRGPNNHIREAAEVAQALQRQNLPVHLLCNALEMPALVPLVDGAKEITISPRYEQAHALVLVGYPGSGGALRQALRGGYKAVVLVLGDLPYEQALARHTDMLLHNEAAKLAKPPTNAYVAALHLVCAATELPITANEAEAWGVRPIIDRLVENRSLVDLPDPEVAWQPTMDSKDNNDPYADFNLLTTGISPTVARSENGRQSLLLDPAGFDRWYFSGAALPPGASGLRVSKRDDVYGEVRWRIESNGRRTYPLRRCTVAVRPDQRQSRQMAGRKIHYGRVKASEDIYAYREFVAGSQPTEVRIEPELDNEWQAPACWIDLGGERQILGQMIGWSVPSALPLLVLSNMIDLVPCYDHESRRMYFVEAHPGGNGLAAWLYDHIEDVLPLAYDIALACRNDPLLEPLSRADTEWLLPLLGKRNAEAPAPAPSPPAIVAPQAPEPVVPDEQPATMPRLIGDERRPAVPAPRSAGEEAARNGREEAADRSRTRQERSPARQQPLPEPPAEETPRPVSRQQPAPEPVREQPAPELVREQPAAEPVAPRQKPAPEPPAADEPTTDAEALIARLRQRRQQQEAQRRTAQPQPRRVARSTGQVNQRFASGDQIFCLPYGNGEVRESYVEDERELLNVAFPDYGELTIDPAVSLVRKIDAATPVDDDLL